MSVNLLSLATQALGGDFARRAGQYMGESEGAAQGALNGLLPALLNTVAQKGSTADGASSILSMLSGPNVNVNWLSNLGTLLAPGNTLASTVMQSGGTILSMLFGDKVGGLASTVASMSGLKAGNASGLMQMVAPLVMGALAKHVTGNNLNAGGLMSLLQGQQASLASSVDSRLSGALGIAGAGATAAAAAVSDGASKVAGTVGAAATAAAGIAASGSHAISSGASNAAAAATTAAKAGGGFMRWLPWIIGAAILYWLLKSCMGPTAGPTTKTGSAVGTPPAATASKPAEAVKPAEPPKAAEAAKPVEAPKPVEAAKPAEAEKQAAAPAAAPSTASTATIPPTVKLYFASGKVDPPAEIGSSLKPIVEYAKANPAAKIQVSGFHDPTGDKAQNEELSKNRAKGIRAQIVQDGIAEDRILMVKPAEVPAGGDNNEARRVEVSIAAN